MHLDTNDLCVGIFQAVTEIGGISGGGITRFDCTFYLFVYYRFGNCRVGFNA